MRVCVCVCVCVCVRVRVRVRVHVRVRMRAGVCSCMHVCILLGRAQRGPFSYRANVAVVTHDV